MKIIIILLAMISNDFWTARELMNEDKFEEAHSILRKIDPKENKDVYFYLGVTSEKMLDNEMAINYYTLFLESKSEKERLRVAANSRLIELLMFKKGTLDEVSQKMRYSERKLGLQNTGRETQKRQKEIVDLLNKMIKDEERKEVANNVSNNSQENQKPEKPQSPKNEQIEVGSSGSSNQSNGKVVKKKYSDGPRSPWSQLRDRMRDPANTAVKEKLPPRYRDLVEKYYEKANKDR